MSVAKMHRRGWNPWIRFVWPLVAVGQWVVVLIACSYLDIWTESGQGLQGIPAVADTVIKGLLNDFFYTVWNIFPIVLWLCYYSLMRWGVDWRTNLHASFPGSEAEEIRREVHRLRDHWIAALVIFGFAFCAALSQFPKQLAFIEARDFVYFWDWRVSKVLFGVRLLALISNMGLIAFIFWHSFMLLVELTLLSKRCNVKSHPLHPDNQCGFKSLGYLLYLLIAPWVCGAFVGVMGWLDHRGKQGMWNLLGDVGLISGTSLVAGLFFFIPCWYIHRQLEKDLGQMRQGLIAIAIPTVLEASTRRGIQTEEAEGNLRKQLASSGIAILLLRDLEKVSSWPVGWGQVTQVVILVGSPSIAILFGMLRDLWF